MHTHQHKCTHTCTHTHTHRPNHRRHRHHLTTHQSLVTAEGLKKMELTDWRSKLGIFGVTGEKQTLPMTTMSPGYRARMVFCLMSLRNP